MALPVSALKAVLLYAPGLLLQAQSSPVPDPPACLSLSLTLVQKPADPRAAAEAASRSGPARPEPVTFDFLLKNDCAQGLTAFVVNLPGEQDSAAVIASQIRFDSALQMGPDGQALVKPSASFSRRMPANVPVGSLSAAYLNAAIFADGSTFGDRRELASLISDRRSLLDGYRQIKSILETIPFLGDAARYASNLPEIPPHASVHSLQESAIRVFNGNIASFVKYGNRSDWEGYHQGKQKWVQLQIDQLTAALANTPGTPPRPAAR
ncbi:hypothetical protein [uncultured Paludibaculum sp.]|uniref:hypothetical protein n=1 Tax=uncultured Paludibaculum sp. TaxID=1765020 RepID=UPI002AAAD04B|nr:hypothetical protein [uncultured Paludibaculum sp.]